MVTNRLPGFSILLTVQFAFAQAPPIQWDKTYGGNNFEEFNIVKQTSDGGYISGGWSQSPISGSKTQPNWDPTNNTPDYWIVKTNAAGVIQWDKRFGGTNWETFGSLQQTSDGGYILGGYSSSPISGDKSQASRGVIDYWIIKLDASGIKQWDARFGGTANDYLTTVIQTSDGGYLLCGFSGSGASGDRSQSNQGANDYWIVKTDASGVKQWDKRFGGPQDDWAYSVIQTNDGGYLIGGTSASGAGGDKSQADRGPSNTDDYWVVKTDANGNKQWDKRFGTTDDDLCCVALQTADGGYILGGYSSGMINGDRSVSSRGTYDYWLVKTDASGIKQWDKRYGGSDIDYLFDMEITTDGGFILGGTSYSGITGDKTQAARGQEDYWIIKTDVNGNVTWDKTMGGNGSDWLNHIHQTLDGYYIAGGWSGSDVSGEKTQGLVGISDYWVIKLGPPVSLPVCLLNFEGKNEGRKNMLTWSTASEINSDYFEVQRSTDMKEFLVLGRADAAGNSSEAISYGYTDMFPSDGVNYYRLKEVDFDGEETFSETISVMANPAGGLAVMTSLTSDICMISFPDKVPFDLFVFDLNGNKIYSEHNLSSPVTLDCTGFPAGLYILEAISENEIRTSRLIRE